MGKRREISNARILVTGASQGIGLALAEAAAQRGAKVLAAARSADLLHDLQARLQSQHRSLATVVADVTQPDDRAAMIEAIRSKLGGLDILINNAGIGATGHFFEAAPERLRRIMEVNFFGVTETTRLCLPLLRAGITPAIVNISSIAAKRGIPARSEYSASKFGVQGFSDALRAELAKVGIDVLIIAPGLTQTNFSKNMLEQKALLQMDHLRGMSSEAVAQAALRAIEAGRNELVLTFQGKLLSWVSRFLPRLADKIAARKVRALFQEEIEQRRKQAS